MVACHAADEPPDAFPQGVASGDPRPDGVLLWTRVEPASADANEPVRWIVATDERLTNVVASGTADASPDRDHTVRVRLTGLAPRTTYYYRFEARGVTSTVGRTRTTPADDDDVPVRIAVASCQDFVGRWYHAWRWLAENAADVDVVLFLGDYIYEYTTGTDTSFDGDAVPDDRRMEVPDGFTVTVDGNDTTAALTLRDYRAIYKRTKTDPWLQRVHALFPFATIWDDHEFANDCWQDHATDFNGAHGDEAEPDRRHAATRAWLEYVPVDIAFADDPRTYRTLRWGKHLEIALTDDRLYRSDHVIPEGPTDSSVGKMLPNSPLGSRLIAKKAPFDERERAANPTMLGDEQRAWLVDTLRRSPATWKVWASGTVVSPMVLDLRAYDRVPESMRDIVYFKLDQWDGYRSERARILRDLDGTRNLVVLSGDIHAFYASHLHVDFDAPGPKPVGVELTTAGITSASVSEQVRTLVDASPLLRALGLATIVDQFDPNLRAASPHFAYTNSATQGIMIVEVDGDHELRASMIQFDDVKAREVPPPSRVERFTVPSGEARIVSSGAGPAVQETHARFEDRASSPARCPAASASSGSRSRPSPYRSRSV